MIFSVGLGLTKFGFFFYDDKFSVIILSEIFINNLEVSWLSINIFYFTYM